MIDESTRSHFDKVLYTDKANAYVTINGANLSLTKSHTGAIVAGSNTTWTLTVANAGPDDAVGPIVITDQLPVGATFTSISGTGWTAGTPNAANVLTLTRNTTLTSGASTSVQVTAGFASSAAASSAATTKATNNACVAAKTFDHDTTDNCVSDPGTVVAEADLALVKIATAISYTAGGGIDWIITVTNHGPSDALVVVVADQLPAGLTFAGNPTSAGDAWSCAASATVTGEVDCTLDANLCTLANGASTWFEFDVDVASSVTGKITNTATVSSDTPDPVTTNNTDAVGYSPLVDTNVSITKPHPTAPVYRAGDEVTFTLTVTNDGKVDAAGVSVVDAMPAGLTFARVENATGWTVTGPDASGHVTLSLDDPLPAGASPVSGTIDVVGILDAGAVPSIVNGATVNTTTTETSTDDNAASDTV